MAFLSSFYPQPVVAGTTEGTFAEGNHSHELDELDASGIDAGKVLTANGLDAASWEDPTGEVEEAPTDGIIYGRKDANWVDITEPANLQVRRGTAAEVAAITPLSGEPVWKTDAKRLVVGDGTTAGGITVGGFPLDGTFRTATNPNSPIAGSIFAGDEVDNRGGAGQGRPYVAGNARGGGAVDLQLQRSVATQVASGARSSILGGNNNTASGNDSSVIGSTGSSVTNTRSVILASTASTNEGLGCVLISGASNTITSQANSSFSIGGNASSVGCFVFRGIGDRGFMSAFGNQLSLVGFDITQRSQAVQFVMKGRTTNDTPTEVTIGNAKLTIPENTVLFGQAEICAIDEAGAAQNAAHYIRKFAIENLGGTTTLIGSVTTVGTDYESAAGLDVEITADDTTDYLKFVVTGISGRNIRWLIVVRGCEMSIAGGT